MKLQVIFFALLLTVFFSIGNTCIAQQANFTAPDSVCVNSPVTIKNLSLGASTFSWNFCVSNIDTTPSFASLGDPGGFFSEPVWMSVVQDAGNYYAFVMNHATGDLVCLSFGASLLNTPSAQDLGNCGVIPVNAEGIQVFHAGGMWTAIVVGITGNGSSYPSKIVKVDLGTSLSNLTPVGTDWGNIGGLDLPVKLYMFQDSSGNYHGFTVNFYDASVTRLDFGASFVNPPTGQNLGNLGNLSNPAGIFSIQDNGNWYLFLTSQGNNTLTRLDFGSSLLNTPTPVNLGNPGNTLNGPRDFYLLKFCGKTVAYVVNEFSNDLVKLDFPGGVTDLNPTAVSLGNPGNNFDFPHSLANFFQVGSNIYTFVTNVNSNTITELIFEGCNNVNVPNSSAFNPPSYSYSIPGIYNIGLLTDVGLPTQSSYCQSIVVLPPPTVNLGNDTSFCAGDSVLLSGPVYPGATYAWSTGSDSSAAYMDTTGKYWLSVNDYGCMASDTVKGKVIPLPVLSLPKDTSFCDSGVVRYVTTQPVTYIWNTGSIVDSTKVNTGGLYWLQLNGMGCTAIDTVQITVVSTHQVYLGKDTSFCGPGMLQYADTAQVTYQWSTGSDSSSSPVPGTGPYWLALTQLGCTSRDTINITVIAQPTVDLPTDTLLCDSGLLRFISPLPVTYHWTTGSDSSAAFITASGLYKLTVNNSGCAAADSTLVAVVQTPPLYLPADATFCGPGILTYTSQLPVTYTWSTGSSGPSSVVPVSGIYWLQLDNQGCTIRDSTQCLVKPVPLVDLGDDTTVCLAVNSYTLNAGNNPGGYTYRWQDSSSSQTYQVTNPGLFSVAVSLNGCTVSDSIVISAVPLPHFTLGADQPICPGEVIYLKPGIDTLTYTWQDGSTDTLYKVAQPGTYYVTGSNACGSYVDSVMIYKGVCVVHVPSAFTPNGDGTNDLFKVLGVEMVDHFAFSIYNRYGRKVFETTDKTLGWDGTSHGVIQPVGTYVYQLGFRYIITGQSYRMDGTVTLIR